MTPSRRRRSSSKSRGGLKPRAARLLIWVAGGTLLLAIVAALILQTALDRYVHRPKFAEELAMAMSKAVDAEVRIGAVSAHVGLRPALKLERLLIVGGRGREIRAESVRVNARLLPLLGRRLVLSSVEVQSPSILIRRAPDGSWPGSLGSWKSGEGGSLKLEIESVSFRDVRFTLVDPAIGPEALIELTGDLAIDRSEPGTPVLFTTRFTGPWGAGRLDLEGRLEPRADLSLRASGVPLALAHRFLPEIARAQAPVDLAARLWEEDGLRWEASGSLRDPVYPWSDRLPLTLEWDAKSSGTCRFTARWVSTGTEVSALLTIPDWRSREYAVQLTGPRFSMDEAFALARLPWPGRGNPAALSTAPWSVSALWDVERVSGGDFAAGPVRGRARLDRSNGEISRLALGLWEGTAALTGSWRHRRGTALISGSGEARGINAGAAAMALGSSVPVAGLFDLTARVRDLPWPKALPTGAARLDALARAKEARVRASGKEFRLERTRPIEWDLEWIFSRGSSKGRLRAESTGGRLAASYSGEPGSHRATADCTNIDLAQAPGIAGRWGLGSGLMTVSARWEGPEIPASFFPAGSTWTLRADMAEGNWRGIPLERIETALSWRAPRARLESLEGRVAGGRVRAEGDLIRAAGSSSTFRVEADLDGVDVAPIFLAFSTQPVLLAGTGAGRVALSGPALPWSSRDLTGAMSLSVKDGALAKRPVAVSVLSALRLQSLFHTVTGRRVEGLHFSVLEASAPIREGRFLFEQPAVFRSREIELAYTGWADLDFQRTEGRLIVNALTGTRDIIGMVPGVSQLVFGPQGEFLPLVVDVSSDGKEVTTNFRSVHTLTGPVVDVVKNLFKLPGRLFRGKTDNPR